MSRYHNLARRTGTSLYVPSLTPPAEHPVTLALQEAIAKYKPVHPRVGWRQPPAEVEVRAGRTLPAPGLVTVFASGQAANAPLWGPTGSMQVIEAAGFALRAAHGDLPSSDVDSAHLKETFAECAVNVLQARRFDRMNPGEKRDLAALVEENAARSRDFAYALRASAHEQEMHEQLSRAQLQRLVAR